MQDHSGPQRPDKAITNKAFDRRFLTRYFMFVPQANPLGFYTRVARTGSRHHDLCWASRLSFPWQHLDDPKCCPPDQTRPWQLLRDNEVNIVLLHKKTPPKIGESLIYPLWNIVGLPGGRYHAIFVRTTMHFGQVCT